MMTQTILFLFSSLYICLTKAELYSSISHISELLKTKSEILSNLDSYLLREEIKLTYIKQFKQDYEELTKTTSTEDSISYLSNPIHAFLLIKKLTTDWQMLLQVMTMNTADDIVQNLTSQMKNMKVPDNEDLQGAAMGLVRVQDIYELKASDIADGLIPGIKTSKKLTANDCFELGRQAYLAKSYNHMIQWLDESLRRWELEDPPTIEKPDILETLAYGLFMMADYPKAINITNQIIGLDSIKNNVLKFLMELLPIKEFLFHKAPLHPRATMNKLYYENLIKPTDAQDKVCNKRNPLLEKYDSLKENNGTEHVICNAATINNSILSNRSEDVAKLVDREDFNKILRNTFKRLCKNEFKLPPSVTANLECRYVDDHPFLKLQPMKLEELFINPFIAVFHDLVEDGEVEHLKEISNPWLHRAQVWNEVNKTGETSPNRTSKFAWFSDEVNPTVKKVSQRISAITKLSLKSAEFLQIANYGIGGHYDPHYDFLTRTTDEAMLQTTEGNRIATVLIYLSNVEAGGATVFPMLGLAIQPKKGSAAFWFNLYKNGEPDYRTQHGACPVISGSKWVCNKWLHEKYQEFIYPCRLDRNK